MQRSTAVGTGIPADKKRKHPETGPEDKSAEETETSVREEEVEEFFAILKRVQTAIKYIEKLDGGGGGKGCKAIEEMLKSSSSFSAVTEEKKVDFDLNVDPAPQLDQD